MSARSLSRMRRGDDQGVAMVVVLLVMVVLTTLGFAMTGIAVGNLNNAGRDRVGGKALAAAEGGIAQAIAHLRSQGVNGLASSDWGTTGHLVTIDSERRYLVTITPVVPLDIGNGVRVGTYLIRSVGTAGSGPGQQIIEETVSVKPFDFPVGIFTESNLTASGQVPIFTESVFSRGCINDRDKLTFNGFDAAYRDANGNQIKAAAHSTDYITRSNSCNSNPSSDGNRIHNGSYCAASPHQYDQDGLGGVLDGAAPSCPSDPLMHVERLVPNDSTSALVKTTYFNQEKMEKTYGYRTRGLSDAQYAALRDKARADGTYYESSSNTVQASSFVLPCGAAPCPVAGQPLIKYPVVYFKIPTGSTVTIQNTDIPGFVYPVAADDPCPVLPSAILIVEGGSLKIAGGQKLTGAVFVPDGHFDFQAGQIVGTVFSKTLGLTGNSEMRLTNCALRNVSGGLLTVTPLRFHQDDD